MSYPSSTETAAQSSARPLTHPMPSRSTRGTTSCGPSARGSGSRDRAPRSCGSSGRRTSTWPLPHGDARPPRTGPGIRISTTRTRRTWTSTSCDVPLRSCERRSRSSRPRIGSAYAWPPPNRMRLGGEDHLPEVERLRRGEQQEEIFQRLREAEAVHLVGPLLRHDIAERGVPDLRSAVADEALEERLAHLPVPRIARELVQVVRRFGDLGPQRIRAVHDSHRPIVEPLRLDAVHHPHPVARVVEASRAVEVSRQREDRGEERVEGPEYGRGRLSGEHVRVAIPQLRAVVVREVPLDRTHGPEPHPSAVEVAEGNPALEQVLVVRVDACADVTVPVRPLARLRVDPLADEADRRPAVVDLEERTLRGLVEPAVLRVPAQRAELKQEGARLRGVRLGALRGTGAEVQEAVWEAGRRAEGGQQPRPEVAGEIEEVLVPRQLVAREETAEQPDRDLERADVDVAIELEPLGDQRPRVLGFGVQTHQDHRVERVDRSHEQGPRVPVAIRSREGPQVVVAPRVLAVALPRVPELRLDALRQPRRVRLVHHALPVPASASALGK